MSTTAKSPNSTKHSRSAAAKRADARTRNRKAKSQAIVTLPAGAPVSSVRVNLAGGSVDLYLPTEKVDHIIDLGNEALRELLRRSGDQRRERDRCYAAGASEALSERLKSLFEDLDANRIDEADLVRSLREIVKA